MGSSVAYHLLTFQPALTVAVIERDPTYARASTPLSLGGVRIQFRLKENILMSLYAQEVFWPELAKIVPAFETLKLVRGWAGLYEMNRLDENAILGTWPDLKELYLINGFSGHGLQQSPAAGRYLAELILKRPPALDLSCFSPQRILDNRPLEEARVV